MTELQQTDYSSLDLSLSFELCEKYRRTEYKRKVKKKSAEEKKTTPSKRMLAQTNKEHKRGGKCLNKEQRK